MQDLDHIVDFWIKGVPYVWVPGKTVASCKRYYLLSKDIAAFYYMKTGGVESINMSAANVELSPDVLLAMFSFEDFNEGKCRMIRNHFLVWHKPLSKITNEVRIEGNQVRTWKRSSLTTITVLYKKKQFKKFVLKEHPNKWRFSLVDVYEWKDLLPATD